MTDEQINEIINYFQNKDLPKTFEYPGSKITNCKLFVEAQILRIKQGVPLIKQVSFDHLVRLKQELEQGNTNAA